MEIKFDPTLSGDRRAVRALLASYDEHTQVEELTGYAAFVNRRSKRPGNKPYILDFLDAMSTRDDLVVEVQEASDEAFAPDAFARSVGQTVAVSYPSGESGTGTLLEAYVHPDGTAAEITLEVHD